MLSRLNDTVVDPNPTRSNLIVDFILYKNLIKNFYVQIRPKGMNPQNPSPYFYVFHLWKKPSGPGKKILWLVVHKILPCTLKVVPQNLPQILSRDRSIWVPEELVKSALGGVEKSSFRYKSM